MNYVNDYEDNYITGWVKMYRSFINWEWFDDSKTVHLFIFCIISANHKEQKWRGKTIKKGEFITSLNKISVATGLSIKSIRISLEKLIITGEIKKEGTKYTKITICKYVTYQQNNNVEGTRGARQGHTRGTIGATNNNDNNEKEDTYTKKGFLKDWNELRIKHLKKPSFLNTLTNGDQDILSDLVKDYSREQIQNAMIGLFKQKNLPNGQTTMQSNPKHFLSHFNSYLTAFHDVNDKLYG